MHVLAERLAPCVENRRDADRAPKMSRVAAKGQERLGRRAKEQVVGDAGIALGEGVERIREREDDVAIRDGQEFGPSLLSSVIDLKRDLESPVQVPQLGL